MRLPVDFDCKSSLEAGEIDYIAAERKLPAKSKTVWPRTKLLPEHDLRQGQRTSKLARAANIRFRRPDRPVADTTGIGPSTIPLCSMVPLPVPGRI
jgi:hypothetical protein